MLSECGGVVRVGVKSVESVESLVCFRLFYRRLLLAVWS